MVTIDTEEDDWGTYRPTGSSVTNIGHLPELTAMWRRYEVRPTYFVNYPPLAERGTAEVVAGLKREGDCEWGVHCHPWNSPPLKEVSGRPVSMMNQLSDEENLGKLSHLTDLFFDTFEIRPRAFRAGRWGFGPTVARPLHRLGYETDSSVSPFVDWTEVGGPDYSSSPRRPYRFHADEPLTPTADGLMTEVPTSVGFLSTFQGASAALRSALERSVAARFRVVGILDSLGFLSKRWLSPETTDGRDMILLAQALVRSGAKVLDLTFHSSSLVVGANPFVQTGAERDRFLSKTEEFIEYCAQQGFEFATVSEVAEASDTGTGG
jgi:hypothetical protein